MEQRPGKKRNKKKMNVDMSTIWERRAYIRRMKERHLSREETETEGQNHKADSISACPNAIASPTET